MTQSAVSGPGCAQSAGLRLDETRRDSTSHLSIHHPDWAHRTAAGHLTRPGIHRYTAQSAPCCLSVCWLVGLLLSTSLPRELPSRTRARTTHWIRMLCAPFYARVDDEARRPACRGLPVLWRSVRPAGEQQSPSCSRNLPPSLSTSTGRCFLRCFFLPSIGAACMPRHGQPGL